MEESYLVYLAKGQEIIFPKICVVCAKPCEEVGHIKGNPDISDWGGFKYLFGLTKKLELYIHKQCHKKITKNLMLRNLTLLFLGLLAVPVIFFVEINFVVRILISILILSFVFIGALWQVKNPTSFQFVHDEGKLKFTIKNEGYATKFAHLNGVFIERLKI